MENSEDSDQLASQKPADLDLHCFQIDISELHLVNFKINFLNWFKHQHKNGYRII